MNETLENMIPVFAATVVGWLCVAVVVLLNIGAFVTGAAVILALITTMTIWTMWALDQYGLMDDSPSHEREKAKRDDAGSGDARAALLLSLLTPDEREALKSRLADELSADGEAVSLADLLDDQESAQHHTH